MTAKDPGGTIEVTNVIVWYKSRPITVAIQSDELDEKALPDAIDAALSLCSGSKNTRDIACYLYDVLRQAFDVVSVEVRSGDREGQV